MKAILKYGKYPSIVAIRNKCKNKDSFSFLEVEKKERENEILNLDANKAFQNSDTSVHVLKEKVDLFCDSVYPS